MISRQRKVAVSRPAGWLRRVVIGTMIVGLPAIAWFVNAPSALAQAATPPVTIRFSVIPLATATPIYVGLGRNYFRDEGINLELTKIEGGAPIAQAIMADSLDGGESGPIPMMIATARGAKILNACTFMEIKKDKLAHGIVVRKDGGIKTLADLKGKTIAVHTLGSLEDIRLRAEVLPSLHLTPADVKIIEVPFSVMEGALKLKRVDAVFPFQPYVTAMAQNPAFELLSDLSQFLPPGGLPVDTYIFSSSFYDAHAAAIASFKRAIARSIAFIEKKPDDASAIVSAKLSFPPDLLKRVIPELYFNRDCKHDVASYRTFASEMKGVGIVPANYDPARFLK